MNSSLIGIDESAPVITRDQIVIDAPLETVWAVVCPALTRARHEAPKNRFR